MVVQVTIVMSMGFVEGGTVEKGQLLYTIDPSEYRSKVVEAQGHLAEANTLLAKAEADLARIRPLAEMKAVSQLDLDAAAVVTPQRRLRKVRHGVPVEVRGDVADAQAAAGERRLWSPAAARGGDADDAAFSTASAPVEKKIDLASSIGARSFRRSASAI